MKPTGHDAATVRAIAIYQKVVVAFILLYVVAIVFGLALPDDLRPMLQYLMLPLSLIAGVFLFLLVMKVFGARIGAVLLALDLALIGGALYREPPTFSAPPTRKELKEELSDEEYNEIVKLIQSGGIGNPDLNPVDIPQVEISREELARRRKEKFAAKAFDTPPPAPRWGPSPIWVFFLNLAIVLVVNIRANSILRDHRISTGLLGADLTDFIRQETKTQ